MPAKNKKTILLALTETEHAALDEMAARHEISKTAVMRQALRLYQLVNHRLEAGETLQFSGDQGRSIIFLGIGFSSPENK
jgi:predicted ArsR family transcriptional regulator